MVADNLPDEQIDCMRKMFHMMDKDKNGNLSFEELKDGLSMIGHSLPDLDVKMLMDAVSSLPDFPLFQVSSLHLYNKQMLKGMQI